MIPKRQAILQTKGVSKSAMAKETKPRKRSEYINGLVRSEFAGSVCLDRISGFVNGRYVFRFRQAVEVYPVGMSTSGLVFPGGEAALRDFLGNARQLMTRRLAEEIQGRSKPY